MTKRIPCPTFADLRSGRISWRVSLLSSVPAAVVGILNGASL